MFTLDYRGEKIIIACVYPLYIYVNSDGKGKVLKQFKLSRHYKYSAKKAALPYMCSIYSVMPHNRSLSASKKTRSC